MRKGFIWVLLIVTGVLAQAQDPEVIEDEFEELTSQWLEQSDILHQYDGINSYCQEPDFRKSVNKVLDTVHHYDSLIMQKLRDPVLALSVDYKEQKKTIKDIAKLELEYSTKDFIEHMREACVFRNEIEADAEALKKNSGAESYDAQVLILETEIQRYLNHIDKLVTKVEDHLHYLYIVD